jgi:ferric-dicitrate binding protein FerR (iron transport regulator)
MDRTDPAFAEWLAEQQKKQLTYERTRRAWAEAVGRPYQPLGERDPRPPPGAVEGGETE